MKVKDVWRRYHSKAAKLRQRIQQHREKTSVKRQLNVMCRAVRGMRF